MDSAWKENHERKCSGNYVGSAPGMETEGALRIFKRSLEKHGARYMQYYGDGESMSFENKVQHIFPGEHVKKI